MAGALGIQNGLSHNFLFSVLTKNLPRLGPYATDPAAFTALAESLHMLSWGVPRSLGCPAQANSLKGACSVKRVFEA